MEEKILAALAEINQKIDDIEKRLEDIEDQLFAYSRRMDRMETDVARLYRKIESLETGENNRTDINQETIGFVLDVLKRCERFIDGGPAPELTEDVRRAIELLKCQDPGK